MNMDNLRINDIPLDLFINYYKYKKDRDGVPSEDITLFSSHQALMREIANDIYGITDGPLQSKNLPYLVKTKGQEVIRINIDTDENNIIDETQDLLNISDIPVYKVYTNNNISINNTSNFSKSNIFSGNQLPTLADDEGQLAHLKIYKRYTILKNCPENSFNKIKVGPDDSIQANIMLNMNAGQSVDNSSDNTFNKAYIYDNSIYYAIRVDRFDVNSYNNGECIFKAKTLNSGTAEFKGEIVLDNGSKENLIAKINFDNFSAEITRGLEDKALPTALPFKQSNKDNYYTIRIPVKYRVAVLSQELLCEIKNVPAEINIYNDQSGYYCYEKVHGEFEQASNLLDITPLTGDNYHEYIVKYYIDENNNSNNGYYWYDGNNKLDAFTDITATNKLDTLRTGNSQHEFIIKYNHDNEEILTNSIIPLKPKNYKAYYISDCVRINIPSAIPEGAISNEDSSVNTIAKHFVVEDNKIKLPLAYMNSQLSQGETIQGKFNKEKLASLDGKEIKYGEYVPENVFFNLRKENLLNILETRLNNTGAQIDLSKLKYDPNNMPKLYNYCKGINQFIKKQNGLNPPIINSNKTLYDIDDINYRVIFNVIDTAGLSEESGSSSSESSQSESTDNRSIIERLAMYEEYPLNIMYNNTPTNQIIDMSNSVIKNNYSAGDNKKSLSNKQTYFDSIDPLKHKIINEVLSFMREDCPTLDNLKASSDYYQKFYETQINNLPDSVSSSFTDPVNNITEKQIFSPEDDFSTLIALYNTSNIRLEVVNE